MNNGSTFADSEDEWRLSSFTDGAAACVEVNFTAADNVLVRDGKDRRSDPPIIAIPAPAWASFLKDINAI